MNIILYNFPLHSSSELNRYYYLYKIKILNGHFFPHSLKVYSYFDNI